MRRTKVTLATALFCAVSAAACTQAVVPRAPAALTTADFGTLKAVCGPGKSGGVADQGVTDASIDVGTIADPGNSASPGLDQELFDTATAFAKWCNDAGGIAGRKIHLHLRDAKLFAVAARVVEACGQDFAEVGGGTALDDAGTQQRVDCGLPDFPAFDTSPRATEAPLNVQADSQPIEEQQVSMYRGVLHALPGATKAGFLAGGLPAVVITSNRFKEAAHKTGFTTVYDQEYPITGIENATSYVEAMEAAGVKVLMYTGDVANLVKLEKAMQLIGWYPAAIVEPPNLYDHQLVVDGGDAISNTWVSVDYYPFEMSRENPPTAQYIDIMKADAPGGKIAELGLNAWDAWMLFATAARDCADNLTRACVLAQAASHTDWTAGGIKPPARTSTTNRRMTECYMMLKVDAKGFSVDPEFLPPNSGSFNCDPANVVKLTGHYVS